MTMTRGAAGYARGAGAYARVGVESGVMSASPHQLISMLFDGAGTAIRAAAIEGACNVIAGSSTLLFRGTLLGPTEVYRNGEMMVVDDTITCVGCDCSDESGYGETCGCDRGIDDEGSASISC